MKVSGAYEAPPVWPDGPYISLQDSEWMKLVSVIEGESGEQ